MAKVYPEVIKFDPEVVRLLRHIRDELRKANRTGLLDLTGPAPTVSIAAPDGTPVREALTRAMSGEYINPRVAEHVLINGDPAELAQPTLRITSSRWPILLPPKRSDAPMSNCPPHVCSRCDEKAHDECTGKAWCLYDSAWVACDCPLPMHERTDASND